MPPILNMKIPLDINECYEVHTCSERANCINTDGSYKCQCKQGYSGEYCTGSYIYSSSLLVHF